MKPVIWICLWFAPALLSAQPSSLEARLATPEGLIVHLYEAITLERGVAADWDAVRNLFIDEAIVVLRTSRDSSTVFSADGFIQDFVRFEEQVRGSDLEFKERILAMKPLVFGDMAQILVLYEAAVIGSPRTPTKGIDSFHLIKRGDRWWITSIVNEVVTAQNQIPAELGSGWIEE